MRLLHVERFEFVEFLHDNQRPKYAIASHRWCDAEARFRDVLDRQNTNTAGYQKVEAFAAYIRQHLPSIEWLWIDTCCINKDSAAELSEAINLMFEWYRDAEMCLAYLPDVEAADDMAAFQASEWFERAWTLQELLAPRAVVFLNKSWQVIGHRGNSSDNDLCTLDKGINLEQQISEITRVPLAVLRDYGASAALTTSEKLAWMDGRKSTKEEDKSYALYGLLEVSLGANYGEREKARDRLLAAIRQRENLATEQAEFYVKASSWISSTNPWENHRTARQLRQPETGNWLLQSEEYQAWKSGLTRHLWLYGPAGCGKTIICSTIIDDIGRHCAGVPKAGQAFFYFSFADTTKQSFENMVRSVVAQLAQKEPGLSLLRRAYENCNTAIGIDELCRMLHTSIASYDEVFLHLDALDECPVQQGVEKSVLSSLSALLLSVSKLRMIATSRDNPEIRRCMESLNARTMTLDTTAVNKDIKTYISSQLMLDSKLSLLPDKTKRLVEDTLSKKADGMFRWADCQLQELRRSKSTKPKAIQAALLALPPTLDETYARILLDTTESERSDAIVLLRWIAYAETPRTLGELAEATIIDPTDDPTTDGIVDIENRGGWTDVLAILAGLIIMQIPGPDDTSFDTFRPPTSIDASVRHPPEKISKDSIVRLAHFSVLEYLESTRILASEAKMFHLDPAREHRFLADSCLVYLDFCHMSPENVQSMQDFMTFPLLNYAAARWHYHSQRKQSNSENTRELSLLTSASRKSDWLWCRHIGHQHQNGLPLSDSVEALSSLYYASSFGLKDIIETLIDRGASPSSDGENLLLTAVLGSYRLVHYEIAEMLIAGGADVNAQSNCTFAFALQLVAYANRVDIAKLLIANGADVNLKGGFYGDALQAAAKAGHIEMVKLLINSGADISARGGGYHTAAMAAYCNGCDEVLAVLRACGCEYDPTSTDALGRNALHIAAAYTALTRADGGLWAAVHIDVVDKHGWTALHWATYIGASYNVKWLLENGADRNKVDYQGWTPYRLATFLGDEECAIALADSSIDGRCQGRSPSRLATYDAEEEEVISLEDTSADRRHVVGERTRVRCDFCQRESIGTNYHCTTCPASTDYDLCFRCFRDADAVHPGHTFTTEFRYPWAASDGD